MHPMHRYPVAAVLFIVLTTRSVWASHGAWQKNQAEIEC